MDTVKKIFRYLLNSILVFVCLSIILMFSMVSPLFLVIFIPLTIWFIIHKINSSTKLILKRLTKHMDMMPSQKRDKLIITLLKKKIKKFDKNHMYVNSADKAKIIASDVVFIIANREKRSSSCAGTKLPLNTTEETFENAQYNAPELSQLIDNKGTFISRIILASSVHQEECDELMDCPDCDGDGKCSLCNNGKVECRRCYGNGKCKSLACKHGKVPCSACNGRGTKNKSHTVKRGGKSYLEFIKAPCYKCHGSGLEDCLKCGGSGKCIICHGSGEVECQACHGSTICSKCDGEGLVTCDLCNGTGVVSTFDYVEDIYSVVQEKILHENYEYPAQVLNSLQLTKTDVATEIKINDLISKINHNQASWLEQSIFSHYQKYTTVRIFRQEQIGEIFIVAFNYNNQASILFFSSKGYDISIKD